MCEERRCDPTHDPATHATALANHGYGHDAAGNVTSISDDLDTQYSRSFGYDDLNRLVTANAGTGTTVMQNGVPVTTWQTALWGGGTYTYDRVGNMLETILGTTTGSSGRSTSLTYSGTTPRVQYAVRCDTREGGGSGAARGGSWPFRQTTLSDPCLLSTAVTDDAAGNELTAWAQRTYSPRNLLATISEEGPVSTSASYQYDGRNVRVWQEVSTVNNSSYPPELTLPVTSVYFYSPELRLLSMANDDFFAPQSFDIVWLGNRPIAQIPTDDASAIRYTFADHLATPLIQTNASGTIVWHAEHEPYGNVFKMRVGAAADQPLRFPGQEYAGVWDGAEENYNIFRWYRSGWGRYTQADPIGLRGGINIYGYTGNNPVARWDRLGLKCCVKRIYGSLRRFQGGTSGFTNKMIATVCADVGNADDGVVTQDILSIRVRYDGQWRQNVSERTRDGVSRVERTAGKICMTDDPGPNNAPATDFPMSFGGIFETKVSDRSDPADQKSIRWSVTVVCATPTDCLFNGR